MHEYLVLGGQHTTCEQLLSSYNASPNYVPGSLVC